MLSTAFLVPLVRPGEGEKWQKWALPNHLLKPIEALTLVENRYKALAEAISEPEVEGNSIVERADRRLDKKLEAIDHMEQAIENIGWVAAIAVETYKRGEEPDINQDDS